MFLMSKCGGVSVREANYTTVANNFGDPLPSSSLLHIVGNNVTVYSYQCD